MDIRTGSGRFLSEYGFVRFPCSNYIDEIDPGILVFATQKDGLYVYNLNTGQKKQISAADLGVPADKSLSITSFCRDSEHNLWMTTERQGLLSVDKHWKIESNICRIPRFIRINFISLPNRMKRGYG